MKLLRNSTYSLLGAAVPALLSIITVPFYIGAIGAERYGVLAIAWLVLGYFGAADFGFGRAITQRVAAMQTIGPAGLARSVWSAIVSMAGLGVIGAILLFVFATWYFGEISRLTPALHAEIMPALWLLALGSPLVALNGVLAGALMGTERFRLVAIANLIGTSALLLLPLAAAWWWSIDLGSLLLAALAARFAGVAIVGGGVWHAFLQHARLSFSWQEFRSLTHFGAWVMVTALVSPLMVLSDRFVIGAMQNAAAVAAYAIPFQIASRSLMLPFAIAQALFPRFAAEHEPQARSRCRDFAVFVALIFAPPIIVLICLAEPLLRLWLGNLLDPRSIMVAPWLLAGFWTNAIAQVPFGFIQARGHPRFTALLQVAELPIYAALLVLLGSAYGLPGFAAAFAIRCAADSLVLCRKAGALDCSTLLQMAIPALLVGAGVAGASCLSHWQHELTLAFALGGLSLLALLFLAPISLRRQLLARTPLGQISLLARLWRQPPGERLPPA